MASDREITLGDLWRAIWRGKWIVLATTVIAGLVAFGITYTADTTYSATSKVYLGQATTILGNLASTPGTNPLTAATMLQGDAVVDAVAKETGLTRGQVRARSAVSVPRAPGTSSTGQPAIASIRATTSSREESIRLANAYAEAALTSASTGYQAVSSTLEQQVHRLSAEEARLQARTRRDATADDMARLADVREVLVASELQLARAQQIEAPAIVTLATGASSSARMSNRVRTAITGAIIGFLVGIVIALATSGGLRRGDGTA
ncbi:MAG: Wzz/FepE/Etk N-terminal domain-containing protein [Miltoncostaeaceae bacterium]